MTNPRTRPKTPSGTPIRFVLASILMGSTLACGDGIGSSPPDWCAAPEGVATRWYPESVVGDTLALTELWRVGGADGEEIFGAPTYLSVSPAGRVAVPDLQVGTVTIVEPDGRWSGGTVQRGRGPGDVTVPAAAQWIDDERLLVFDVAGGKVVEWSQTGDSLIAEHAVHESVYRQILLAGQLPAVRISPNGSLILELPWIPLQGDPPDARATVVRAEPGSVADTLVATVQPVLGAAPFESVPMPGFSRPFFSVDPAGAIAFIGDTPRYRVRVLRATGADSLWVCREVEASPLSDFELGTNEDPDGPAAMMAAIRERTPTDDPAEVGSVLMGASGRIWIHRERPGPPSFTPSAGGMYDVFEPGGAYLGGVTLPENVVLAGDSGSIVYGMESGEFGVLQLVAYRLEVR